MSKLYIEKGCECYDEEYIRVSKLNVSERIVVAKNVTLKIAIYETGLSQKKFADKVGVNPTHLSAIVNGKEPKLLRQAQRIAKAVGMTVDDLWPLEEDDE